MQIPQIHKVSIAIKSRFCPLLKRTIIDCSKMDGTINSNGTMIPIDAIQYCNITQSGGPKPTYSIAIQLTNSVINESVNNITAAQQRIKDILGYKGTTPCGFYALTKVVNIETGIEEDIGYCAYEAIAQWKPYNSSLDIRSSKVADNAESSSDSSSSELGGNY